MSKWEVKLYCESTNEFDTTIEAADEKADVETAALDDYSDEWEIAEITRLCDFCEPAPHPNCEAHTQISVSDPADMMTEPHGNDAPGCSAWVCYEHYEVVKQLPTFRAN